MPCRPQKLAGTRTDPPVSVPSAVSQRPWATAEAEPDEEPPGTRSGARGLSGVPSKAFSPRMPSETSSVIVLPIRVAPASRRRCTAQACRVGIGYCRAQSGLPPPVGWPATSKRSFAAKVMPASGPPGAPAIRTVEPGTNGLVTGTDTDAAARAPSSGVEEPHLPYTGRRHGAESRRRDDPDAAVAAARGPRAGPGPAPGRARPGAGRDSAPGPRAPRRPASGRLYPLFPARRHRPPPERRAHDERRGLRDPAQSDRPRP